MQERGPAAEKKFKKAVDKGPAACYNIRAKGSRNGAPSSPQARAKGSTVYFFAGHPAQIFHGAGADSAAAFYFSLEVLSHR